MSTSTTKSRKKTIPLIIEPHPKDYNGLPFITLLQYRKIPTLVIVDNADQYIIKVFNLDLCGPENIDENILFEIAIDWYENNRTNYPISVEFSKRGLTKYLSSIYRTFNIEFVSRAIGPLPKYPMLNIRGVKRKRRKSIPQGVEIVESTVEDVFE